MAKNLPEEKLIYMMTVLKHSDLPKPDWKGIADETGQSSANNAQKKYKAIIESLGFKLSDNQIIDSKGGATTQTPTPVSTPRGKKTGSAKSTPAKKTNGTPKSKASASKRKVEALQVDSSEDDRIEESNLGNQNKRTRTLEPEVKREAEIKNEVVGVDDVEDEVEIVAEGTVAGGFRGRSPTISPIL